MPRLAVHPLEGRDTPSVAGLVAFDAASGELRFTAAGGTANDLSLSFDAGAYTLTDAAAPLGGDPSLPAGWSAPDANTVVVPAAAVAAVVVRTGDGDDLVTVTAAADAVSVDTGAGSNAVTLGGPGGMAALAGPAVAVRSPGGTAALTLYDADNPDPSQVTLDGPAVLGLAAGPVSYTPGEVTEVAVLAGAGGNVVVVAGTPAGVVTRLLAGAGDDAVTVRAAAGPLHLDGHGGYDHVALGADGSTAGLLGPVVVGSAGGAYELAVDDTAGTAARVVTVSDDGVGGLTPGGIVLSGATIITLRTGAGNDTFAPAEPSVVPTLLFAGPGDDRLVIPNEAAPNAVFDGEAGTDVVDLSGWTTGVTIDLAAGLANSVSITGVENAVGGAGADALTGDGGPNVLVGGGADTLSGGDGDDTYLVTPGGGGTTTVADPAGADALSFAAAVAGVVLDLDAVGWQSITAAGDGLVLTGQLEAVVGTPFDDVLTAGPLTATRSITGGGAATASPGDTIRLGSLGLPWVSSAGAFQVQGYAPVALSGLATVVTPASAVDDAYRTTAGRPLDVAAPGVLGNDRGAGAAARLVAGPAHGTLTLNPDGSFRYVPAAGYVGTDSFVYQSAAGAGASPGVVTVAVGSPLAGVYAVGAGAGAGGGVRVFNPDGSTNAAFLAFRDAPGGVRVAVADFDGDGTPDVAAGTGPGVPAAVRVVSGVDGSDLYSAGVFEGFVGGVFLAAGDLDGDGRAELVLTPDEGGGPRVVVLRGGGFATAANFFGIADPAFRGGVRAAVGDLSGDGRADLVVAAGFGGGPRVALFEGGSVLGGGPTRLTADFFVFEPGLRNGAYVAVGDVDGDGTGELIGGAGPGGAPRVLALSGAGLMAGREVAVANFFAGSTANRGGVRVAVKNLDGDGRADIVVGDGAAAGSRVTAYAGKDFAGGGAAAVTGFDAVPGFAGGVFVG